MALLTSLLIIVFMIGVGLGYYFTPEYKANMYNPNSNMIGLGESDYFLDKRYLDQMIAHHQAAIKLAEQAINNSERPEIKELSKHIIENEPALMEELYQWKESWYRDGRPAPTPRFYQLGEKGDNFDLRFLNALIAHHQEGIAMAEEVKYKSSRAEVLDNADQIISALNASLDNLKEWRQTWY